MAERIQGLDEPIGKLWNVDTCPEALLPWLAWSFSVEVWDHAWPVETKRAVIRKSILVHRWKGTRRSVEEALEAIGVSASIREWFEAGGVEVTGAPGTFEIWIDMQNVLATGAELPALLGELRRVVDATKPVSAHYTAHARITAKAPEYGGVCSWFAGGRLTNTAGIPPIPTVTSRMRGAVTSFMTGSIRSPILEAPV